MLEIPNNSLLARIKNNHNDYLAGRFNYIPLHKDFGTFAQWYPGTMRGEYVGLTGGTSSAKSQITRCIFLYGAIEWAIRNNINLRVKWFGLEESEDEARYYLLSWLLFKTYKVRYNIEHFEGIGKTMYPEDLEKVGKIQDTFDKFWSYIDFFDSTYTTSEIHDTVLKGAEERGTFYLEDTPLSAVNRLTKYTKYVAHDPNEFVIVVGDHFGILEQTPDESDERKSMIRLSKIFRQHFCKRLNYICVGVIQQMAAMEDLEHVKAEQVYASLQGFGDCKVIARDMMTVIGITNINRYGINTAITQQENIGLKGKINFGNDGIGDFQRVLGILKRRYGVVNKRAALGFDGCVGHFFGFSSDESILEWGQKIESFSDGYKTVK